MDARSLIIDGREDLIVIAGVGGELICEILMALQSNSPGFDCDMVISPNNSIHKVKNCLLVNNFQLEQLSVICDSGWTYEILKIRKGLARDDRFLDLSHLTNVSHRKYLEKIICHIHKTKCETEIAQKYLELFKL